jgi:ABC-type antimicrobial peptide transport system permease subunit
MAMVPLGIGILIGMPGALGVGRLLQGLLIQTSPTDPATLIAITVLLVSVSAAACFFPARRAARLDPLRALRND